MCCKCTQNFRIGVVAISAATMRWHYCIVFSTADTYWPIIHRHSDVSDVWRKHRNLNKIKRDGSIKNIQLYIDFNIYLCIFAS